MIEQTEKASVKLVVRAFLCAQLLLLLFVSTVWYTCYIIAEFQEEKLARSALVNQFEDQIYLINQYVGQVTLALVALDSLDWQELLMRKERADQFIAEYQGNTSALKKQVMLNRQLDEQLKLMLTSYRLSWERLKNTSVNALRMDYMELQDSDALQQVVARAEETGLAVRELISYIETTEKTDYIINNRYRMPVVFLVVVLFVFGLLCAYFFVLKPLITLYKKQSSISSDALRKLEDFETANSAQRLFLANMSHEIRTPMVGVLGYAQLLKETELTETQQEYSRGISVAGTAMLNLIDDVLYFSKIESGSLELMPTFGSVATLMEDVGKIMRPMFEDKGLSFSIESKSELPETLKLDFQRLRQVILNIVNNSYKYTSVGGVAVTLSFLDKRDRPLVIRSGLEGGVEVEVEEQGERKDGVLILRFTDTGEGIEQKDRQRLFQAFQQAESANLKAFGGVGLGLSIVRSILDAMGGNIEWSSEVGVGTTTIITIPVALSAEESCASEEQKALLEGAANSVEGASRAGRILVVEDNVVNQKVMMQMLKKHGCDSVLATNGEIAVKMSADEEFALVLMDYEMPIMNGVEATKRIRAREIEEQKAHTPIVAVSANTLSTEREAFLKAGVDGYLSKPFTFESLGQLVGKWVKSSDQITTDLKNSSLIP